MRKLVWLILPLALTLACSEPAQESASMPEETDSSDSADYWAYFGVYTTDTSKGIYKATFDSETGAIGEPELAAEIRNPSFIAFHPNKKVLYSVGESDGGSVSAFEILPDTGGLILLNTQSAMGAAPCDLEVDKTGSMLVVANYTSGNTVSYKINDDGSLSEPVSNIQHEGSGPSPRQKGPHAHSVDFTPDNQYVFVSDLGIDRVLIYRPNPEDGSLEKAGEGVAPAGSGPRHFALHPDGKFAYSLGEISSTVTPLTWADGKLEQTGETVSTLPADYEGEGNTTAEIAIAPNGKTLYASNRGHDSIAVFSINEETGALTLESNVSTQGETPRNFKIDPTGKWLLAANQKTDNVVVFGIDEATGALSAAGKQVTVDAPVCIDFLGK